MRVLVTGAGGFVGRHVVGELISAGHVPLGFDVQGSGDNFHVGDLRDADAFRRLVAKLAPDACIHLAGIAFVPLGWTDPELVFSVNLFGTINLLETFRAIAPQARLLVVTSAEVYRKSQGTGPLAEDAPLMPANPYAISKMAADCSALLYARQYEMPVMTARPENHIGPGQSPRFVTSSFAAQLAAIKCGEAEPLIKVGNLDSSRDFTDVRDIARAYRLLIEKGSAGKAYNIASGNPTRIGAILDRLCEIAEVHPRVEVDQERFRAADDPPLLDTSRIRTDTGWVPTIPLDRTLTDIYRDMQNRHVWKSQHDTP